MLALQGYLAHIPLKIPLGLTSLGFFFRFGRWRRVRLQPGAICFKTLSRENGSSVDTQISVSEIEQNLLGPWPKTMVAPGGGVGAGMPARDAYQRFNRPK